MAANPSSEPLPFHYRLQTFLEPGFERQFNNSFYRNMKSFLRNCTEYKKCRVANMPTWCVSLDDEESGSVMPLYICAAGMENPCMHCREIGWENHFLCRTRYHLFIAEKDGRIPKLVYNKNNLLHGMIHSNGYGHLICVNRKGKQVMELWERICVGLGAREISLTDSAKERQMELRLIHAVEYGKSYFAEWEYEPFGIDNEEYKEVLDKLSSTPVMDIVHDFEREGKDERLRGIVNYYRIPELGILQQLLIRMKKVKERCLKSYPMGGLISDAIPEGGIISEIISNSILGRQEIIEKINGDIDYIYKDILLGYDNMKNSTAAILNARHFKKSFTPLQPDIRTQLQYWVNAVPKRRANGKRRKGKRKRDMLAPVLVLVPLTATEKELMAAGQRALRETYTSLTKFKVAAIQGINLKKSDLVADVLPSGATVHLKGI